jgi:hypothetical protein
MKRWFLLLCIVHLSSIGVSQSTNATISGGVTDRTLTDPEVVRRWYRTYPLVWGEVAHETAGQVAGSIIVRELEPGVSCVEGIQVGRPNRFALLLAKIERPGARMISGQVEGLILLGPHGQGPIPNKA